MSRIYLGSNIYVYYFEGHPEFGRLVRSIVERARQLQHRILSSLFVLSELLVEPVRGQDEVRIASLNRFFRSDAVTLLPYAPEAVSTYTSLRADHRVKPLDALHLACAACAGTDLFLTNDTPLKQLSVPGNWSYRRIRRAVLTGWLGCTTIQSLTARSSSTSGRTSPAP